jgi:hypothetical protein
VTSRSIPQYSTPRLFLSLAALAVLIPACRSNGARETGAVRDTAADTAAASPAPKEFKVTNVMIGKHVGEGDRITEPAFQFAPADTVYLSVATEGTKPEAKLSTKWFFQTGKMVDSASRTIQPKGAQQAELHVAPAKGWAVGNYVVKVYADGDSVETKTFAVRK